MNTNIVDLNKLPSDAAASASQLQPRLAFDIHDSAKTLSVSEQTIRVLIRRRRLPRIGGIRKILVPVAALQKFAASAE
jgi:hypothetical protein